MCDIEGLHIHSERGLRKEMLMECLPWSCALEKCRFKMEGGVVIIKFFPNSSMERIPLERKCTWHIKRSRYRQRTLNRMLVLLKSEGGGESVGGRGSLPLHLLTIRPGSHGTDSLGRSCSSWLPPGAEHSYAILIFFATSLFTISFASLNQFCLYFSATTRALCGYLPLTYL